MPVRVKTINPETNINNLDDEINEAIEEIEIAGGDILDIKYVNGFDEGEDAAAYTALITYRIP